MFGSCRQRRVCLTLRRSILFCVCLWPLAAQFDVDVAEVKAAFDANVVDTVQAVPAILHAVRLGAFTPQSDVLMCLPL